MSGDPKSLTAASSLPAKLSAYMAERFPLSVNGPAIVLMLSSGYLVAAQLVPGAPPLLGLRALAGAAILFFFFLRLRISDEHKDVAYDRIVNPERLVVRGVVTLGELKALGVIGAVVEVACACWLGTATFVAWLIAAVWSFLMHHEFFCAEWLRVRPGPYMLTHMTVVPLLTFFCFECAAPFSLAAAPAELFLFALSSALATASLEVARKIRLPADEAPGVESYSSSWGFAVSLGVVAAMQLGSFGLLAGIATRLGAGPVFLGCLVFSWVVVLASLARFGIAHDRRYAGKLDKVAALYFLTLHIGLTASLWR